LHRIAGLGGDFLPKVGRGKQRDVAKGITMNILPICFAIKLG
jgi:hypothetical protein